MYSYILIQNTDIDEKLLEDFLRQVITKHISFDHYSQYIMVIYPYDEELELSDTLKAFIYDMNANIRFFVSEAFSSLDMLYDNADIIANYFDESLKESVYTQKTLVSEICFKAGADLKAITLKEYTYDLDMYNLIISFVQNNLNVLQTSKAMYMHRNTLINKLDRFYEKTGYDLRCFLDAYVIYTLIK